MNTQAPASLNETIEATRKSLIEARDQSQSLFELLSKEFIAHGEMGALMTGIVDLFVETALLCFAWNEMMKIAERGRVDLAALIQAHASQRRSANEVPPRQASRHKKSQRRKSGQG